MSGKPPYANRYGRRAGRGLRPWLLIPKIVGVSLYLGGLAAVQAIWLFSAQWVLARSDPRGLLVINQAAWLMEFLVVPGLLLAILAGLALMLQMPRVFLRMRWMQVKLATLAVLIPTGHLFLSSRLGWLREAALAQRPEPAAFAQFVGGLAVVLAVSVWVVVLGRVKPRLRRRAG